MRCTELRALLLIIATLACLSAQAVPMAQPIGERMAVQVVDCGRYRILQREPRQADGVSTAGFSSVVKTELMVGSTRIPLQLGEAFGFRYRLQPAASDSEWLPLQIVIHHPPLTDIRGRRSEGFVIDSAARRSRDGSYRNGAFYVLSDQRELVAGRWRIELVHAGRTLVSREFTLEPGDGQMAGTQLAEPETWHP